MSERTEADATFRIESVLREDAFPHPVARLALRETHLSWVILTGLFAYKIKKPVRLPFIDTSSLERRRELCEAELRLNQRLAADLYIDVVPIRRARGMTRIAGDGITVEHAVRMHQFDPAQELHALLERASVSVSQVCELARRLALFHAAAERSRVDPDRYPEELRHTVLGNIAILRAHLTDPASSDALARIVQWSDDALERTRAALSARARAGWVREGHGDLHARNIVLWNERLTPFDCLEFEPRLRQIDVLDDLAFLVMDLIAHRRRDLACALLSAYLEETGDYEGVPLVPVYAVHRALVRAMVDALSLEQQPQDSELLGRLRRRVQAAITLQQRAFPALFIMHGLSGSGKSWLSAQLVAPLEALRIRSDLERKRLGSGTTVSGAADEPGRYSSERNRATYERLEHQAAAVLAGGFNVIIDAAFLRREDRDRFRAVARRLGARFRILHCRADESTMRARIEERATRGGDPSEATAAVLALQQQQAEALTPQECAEALEVDTRSPEAVALAIATLRGA